MSSEFHGAPRSGMSDAALPQAIILVDRAKALAHQAHSCQVDKSGRPYIEHVTRVAAAVSDDPEAEAVAWLHDVLEDCPSFGGEVARFPDVVFFAVTRLTRLPGLPEEEYYARIRRCDLALRVKLADLDDNSDEERLAQLDPATADRLRRKYAKAKAALARTVSDFGPAATRAEMNHQD